MEPNTNTQINAAHSETMSHDTQPSEPVERLTLALETILAPQGFELVALEVQSHREKILRIYVDANNGITIDDCVRVNEILEQPLEELPEINEIFGAGAYELEVSSPGIERPLRKSSDFEKFAGEFSRVHTYRPLTETETLAAEYSAKNPKQKNYFGVIRGYDSENRSVLFGALPEDGTYSQPQNKSVKPGAKVSKKKLSLTEEAKAGPLKNETLIRIPHSLISKAHLEPRSPL